MDGNKFDLLLVEIKKILDDFNFVLMESIVILKGMY